MASLFNDSILSLKLRRLLCFRAYPRQYLPSFLLNFFCGELDRRSSVGSDNWSNLNSKPADGLEQGIPSDSSNSGFWKKLDKTEKAYDGSGMGNISSMWDDLYHDSLTDGMDQKLKKAATYFEFDPGEVSKKDYTFRPDANFPRHMNYDTKDLDLRIPGVRKPVRRGEFETTTEEVLAKADFRSVKFLANFITEAGVMEKRSRTGISAKAQRKIAREIKTARAFGLMPFTTMGTKQFVYGSTMEDESRDFEYESYDHTFVDEDVGDA